MFVVAVGHCEDKEALPFMARADLRRREQSSLTRKAQSVKVSPNPLGAAAGEHAADVLDEDEPRARLDDDATCGRPEVARVFALEPLSGKTVRLARYAANEAVHASTPASAVEGSGIAPNRRWSEMSRLHR